MNWRSKKLLAAAKDAPHCMSCFMPNDGTVVAAHSNQIRDGKGTGIKAHDYRSAFICGTCHYEIDNGSGLSRSARIQAWEDAHRHTVGWLFESGRLEIK